MNSFNLALKSYSWFIENSFVALKFLFVIFLVAIPIAWAQANPGWLVGLIAYPLWLIVISAVMIQLHRFILLDLDTNEIRFIEKPKKNISNLAVTGLYFFDNNVVKYSKTLKPTKRGKIEKTDLLNIYKKKFLHYQNIAKFLL